MIIGLTGGIACGKSSALAIFKRLGYRTLDADEIVRGLLASDRTVQEEIRAAFGAAVFDSQAAMDRGRLAQLVFKDASALATLESILHPRVRESWMQAISLYPKASWLIEIPLLFEKNLEKSFERSLCITCSEQQQLARLSLKGVDCEQAKYRMAAQLPLKEKMERADYVLLNSGSLQFLEQEIIYLSKQLK